MRTTVLLIFLISSVIAWGNCLDRVPNEYLIRHDSSFETVQSQFQRKTTHSIQIKRKIFNSQSRIKGKTFSKVSNKPSLSLVKSELSKSELEELPGVLSAEPNCLYKLFRSPNDSQFDSQVHHSFINSERAWDISIGTRDIIVAISDSGVDYNHQDLAANMWVNELELNGQPNVDDDNNGCVDDIYGCDFADNDGDPRPGFSNAAPHGTHVAGIVGAVGNNQLGVTGVVWNVKLMAIKGFPNNSDGANVADLLSTVYYAVDNGAHIINCSWGSNQSPTLAERDAFEYARNNGVMAIVAAGNSSQNAINFSPAGLSDVITVGSINTEDRLSAFSNFGNIVDIVAPGGDVPQAGGIDEKILSTYPNNSYQGQMGTSMAAPVVAGIAALIWSINPDLTSDEVESILFRASTSQSYTVPTQPNLSYFYPVPDARVAAELSRATLPPPDPNQPCTVNCDQTDLSSNNDSFSSALNNGMGGCSEGFKPSRGTQSASLSMWIHLWILFIPLSLIIFKD